MTDQQTGMDWAPPPLGECDFIPTQRREVEALLAEFPPPDGPVLDPCAGGGAILQVLWEIGWRDLWAMEIRPCEREALIQITGSYQAVIGDWFEAARTDIRWPWVRGWRTEIIPIVTNPPYSLLPRFAESCLSPERPYVALLMPIEELAGVARAKRYPIPTGMVTLSRRPFPNVRGVAWYVWEAGKPPLDIRVR